MSKKLVLSLALLLALGACGKKEEAKTDEPSIGDAISAVGKLNDLADVSKDTQKNTEELKKLTPVTNDQLKSILPDSIAGIARSSFEITNAMGILTANAKYEKDAIHYELQVYDGAGESGSAIFGLSQLGIMMGTESETQTGYTKPYSVGDNKGSEKQDKTDANNIFNEVTLVVANRFMLTVSARGADMDALKSAIKDADLVGKLEGLK
ncbi:MAG TPA: hypothetical protein PL131_05365 [Methylotenera sp.]|nr:hypothetical protein [Methylotenera sp.]HPH05283.1 hypothetical protein [Methylotenera sp.]HPN00185.1 hypothetical protein [Methylotenera sp.]